MPPRRKSVTSGPRKRARSPSPVAPPTVLSFSNEEHTRRFGVLCMKTFGVYRTIDWTALSSIMLEDEIRELVSTGHWNRLFAIDDGSFREPTLEILSSITLERGFSSLDRPGSIIFQLFGEQHAISVSDFSVLLGIYDREFTTSPEYRRLLTDFPEGEAPRSVWATLTTGYDFVASVNKAMRFSSPSWRFLHDVMARSFSGRIDSTGVVTKWEVLYLHSMIERRPLHLGYMMAEFLVHQGSFWRHNAIFVGPLVTRLIRGLRLAERLRDVERVGSTESFGLAQLVAMRLVVRRGSRYLLVTRSVATEEAEDLEESESGSPATSAGAGPNRQTPPSISHRLSVRMAAMQETLQDIQREQIVTREALATFRSEVHEEFLVIRDYLGIGSFAPPSPSMDPRPSPSTLPSSPWSPAPAPTPPACPTTVPPPEISEH